PVPGEVYVGAVTCVGGQTLRHARRLSLCIEPHAPQAELVVDRGENHVACSTDSRHVLVAGARGHTLRGAGGLERFRGQRTPPYVPRSAGAGLEVEEGGA